MSRTKFSQRRLCFASDDVEKGWIGRALKENRRVVAAPPETLLAFFFLPWVSLSLPVPRRWAGLGCWCTEEIWW